MRNDFIQCRAIKGDNAYVRNGNVFYIQSQRQIVINNDIINNTIREWIELVSNLNKTENHLNELRQDLESMTNTMIDPFIRRFDKNFSQLTQMKISCGEMVDRFIQIFKETNTSLNNCINNLQKFLKTIGNT